MGLFSCVAGHEGGSTQGRPQRFRVDATNPVQPLEIALYPSKPTTLGFGVVPASNKSNALRGPTGSECGESRQLLDEAPLLALQSLCRWLAIAVCWQTHPYWDLGEF